MVNVDVQPIDSIRSDVESHIRCSNVGEPLIVCAPTGSGKSTRLPLWLAACCSKKVLVVEPRRVACRALATYVASLLGSFVGQRVGYRVRFEHKVSHCTQIEFVTPGVALRLLRGQMDAYEVILIDEFHERHWEVDLLIAVLRQKIAQGSCSASLILTSATLEAEALAASMHAKVLSAEGRSFPIQIEYSIEQTAPAMPTIRELEERTTKAILQCLSISSKQEDILVFLPGKGELDACRRTLLPHVRSMDIDLVLVHGSLPTQQMTLALQPDWPRTRVYLSTNVAETSLTLPRVTTVIDSGLARMRMHRGGQSALTLTPISKAQMEQRAGRSGRVAPGKCVRLWRSTFVPEASTRPEIERIELDDCLLQAGLLGVEGGLWDALHWITDPPDFAVQSARQRLLQMGAIDPEGHCTAFGHTLASWPISATEAIWLVDAPKELASTLSDLVALLQQRSSFLRSLHTVSSAQRESILEARQELLSTCTNEVFTALTLLRFGDVRKHFLHASALQQARSIARQLRSRWSGEGSLEKDPTQDLTPFPKQDLLSSWILSRTPQVGFVRRPRAERGKKHKRKTSLREPWANGQMELLLEPFMPSIPEPPPIKMPQAGLILAQTWVGQRGTSIQGRGRMLLPCSLEVLAQAKIGDLLWEEPRLEQNEEGEFRIVAPMVRSLAGVTLQCQDEAIAGTALKNAVVKLMARGRLWPDAAERIRDELHTLEVLSEWPTPKDWRAYPKEYKERMDLESYVAYRLDVLGLEDADDLNLLEASDLSVPIESWTGIDRFSLEEFMRDFPRIWSHKGAEYACLVRPLSGKVRITPCNALARKSKEPAARFLPHFRGFRVEFQKASRVIWLR